MDSTGRGEGVPTDFDTPVAVARRHQASALAMRLSVQLARSWASTSYPAERSRDDSA